MPHYPAPARRHRPPGGEQGNVIVAMIVVMVVIVLCAALLTAAEFGLRGSRRAGDSANALQLADAGINDAVKALNAHSASFTGTSSLGSAGSYAYTATKDGIVWHLDATGTDATGVKRRVLADAVDEPIYTHAFFVRTNASLKGTADSYTSTTDTCSSNPGFGVISSNGTITFTGGSGASNCRGGGWGYAVDGCTFYGRATVPAGAIAAGACPPAPATGATTQTFTPTPVNVPGGLTSEGAFTCDSTHYLPTGTHLYTNLTLSDGCQITGNGETVLYVTGAVAIGTDSGSCRSVIHAPPGACAATPPSSWYVSGWPAKLQINVAGNGDVSLVNHAIFFGVVNAPNSLVTALGGGTPQVNVFGSIVANSAAASAQFAFHYDQSLRQGLTTGQYQIVRWREEPVP